MKGENLISSDIKYSRYSKSTGKPTLLQSRKMPGETKTNLLPDFIHLERLWCPYEKPVSHTALTSTFLSTWEDDSRSPKCVVHWRAAKELWAPRSCHRHTGFPGELTGQGQLFFWWCNTWNFNSLLDHVSELTAQRVLKVPCLCGRQLNLLIYFLSL